MKDKFTLFFEEVVEPYIDSKNRNILYFSTFTWKINDQGFTDLYGVESFPNITYEKANEIINKLVEENLTNPLWLSESSLEIEMGDLKAARSNEEINSQLYKVEIILDTKNLFSKICTQEQLKDLEFVFKESIKEELI